MPESIYDYPSIYHHIFNWDRDLEVNFLDSLFCYLNISKSSKILELGCGTGLLTRPIHDLNWYVSGMDISKKMLSSFRRRHKGIILYQGDMKSFYFGQKWNSIFCMGGTVGFLSEKKTFLMHLNNIYQNLLKGGFYIFEAAHKATPGNTLFDYSPYRIDIKIPNGSIKVRGDVIDFYQKGKKKKLSWGQVPVIFNIKNLLNIIRESNLFSVHAVFPEAGVNEEGIYYYSLNKKGFPNLEERSIFVLKKSE